MKRPMHELPVTSPIVTILFGLAVASLLACGGAQSETGAPAPATGAAESAAAAPAAAPAIDPSACGGFRVDDAAAILGVEAAGLENSKSEASWGTDCNYVPSGDATSENAVSFTLSRAESVDAAQLEMAQLADHAGVADQTGVTEGKSHRVSGIGDEALWVDGSLYVRAGVTKLIVTRPKDETKQLEVAHRIFG